MPKAIKGKYAGFRTTIEGKKRLKRLARQLGYEEVSDYMRDMCEAPRDMSTLTAMYQKSLGALNQTAGRVG